MFRRIAILTIVLAAMFAVTWTAFAQTGDDFDLSWSSVDGGGGASRGGEFFLAGSIGQVDASDEMVGGEYSLVGGFQSGTVVVPPSNVCGDQNDDFMVDIEDVFLDLDFIVGRMIPMPFQLRLSDLDQDGSIGVTDVVMSLKNIAAGGPETESCGV